LTILSHLLTLFCDTSYLLQCFWWCLENSKQHDPKQAQLNGRVAQLTSSSGVLCSLFCAVKWDMELNLERARCGLTTLRVGRIEASNFFMIFCQVNFNSSTSSHTFYCEKGYRCMPLSIPTPQTHKFSVAVDTDRPHTDWPHKRPRTVKNLRRPKIRAFFSLPCALGVLPTSWAGVEMISDAIESMLTEKNLGT